MGQGKNEFRPSHLQKKVGRMSAAYQSVKENSMAKAGLKEDRLKKFDSQDPVEGDTIIRIKANNNSKYHLE